MRIIIFFFSLSLLLLSPAISKEAGVPDYAGLMRDYEKAGGSQAEKSARALEALSGLAPKDAAAGLEGLKTADLAPALYWLSALWRASREAVFLQSAETVFKKLEREKPARGPAGE